MLTALRWAAMSREANVLAARAAHRGDPTLLRDMLDQLVAVTDDPPGQGAALQE